MKWVQLPGTTLPQGEIHTNFSNLIFPCCVWPWRMEQQKDRSREVQVTACIKQTITGISKYYLKTLNEILPHSVLSWWFLERELKTRITFFQTSQTIHYIQLSEKQTGAGSRGCRLSPARNWLYGSIWGRRSMLKTTAKAYFQTPHSGKFPLNYWSPNILVHGPLQYEKNTFPLLVEGSSS